MRGEDWPFCPHLNLKDSLLLTLRKPFFPSHPFHILHYPTLGSCQILESMYPCQILEREYALTMFALCLLMMSEGALKVATLESVAVLV